MMKTTTFSSASTVDSDGQTLDRLRVHLNSQLVGKPDVIEMVITCLLARGHLLFEDMPGLGKTTLAKAIATGIHGSFARVQCTADLLPSDITGFNMFNQKSREFEFRKGPVFADILLTDEINRTPPRTQSALFEAMAERQVSVDGQCFQLNPSFFVMATQNPMESQGVFPLPDAQLDRFAMRLSIGYPGQPEEVQLLRQQLVSVPRRSETLPSQQVVSLEELQRMQRQVTEVDVHDRVLNYLVAMARLSRELCAPSAGLSPRANIQWLRCGQAFAFLQRRDFVTPEDLHEVAVPVLSLRFSHLDVEPNTLIERLLNEVEVPTF